jgi:uncharacterized Tic20 family protein
MNLGFVPGFPSLLGQDSMTGVTSCQILLALLLQSLQKDFLAGPFFTTLMVRTSHSRSAHDMSENETPSSPEPAQAASPAPAPITDRERETNQWAMFIHFSMLAGWVIPLAGLIVPIILWQIKKDELPGIVPHAYIVLNWMISSLVYAAICFVLLIIIIGAFGFVALGLVTIIFAVIGGLKANEGIIWEYPGTIIKVFK